MVRRTTRESSTTNICGLLSVKFYPQCFFAQNIAANTALQTYIGRLANLMDGRDNQIHLLGGALPISSLNCRVATNDGRHTVVMSRQVIGNSL